jgi:hypothetical protein
MPSLAGLESLLRATALKQRMAWGWAWLQTATPIARRRDF